MSKATSYRDQSVDELKALLSDKRKDRFQLLNQKQKEKKLDKPHLLRAARKEIARILTVLTQKVGGK